MKIILGKTAGFCYGVERAIKETKKELETGKRVSVLGEIVHNKSVIDELKRQGVEFIDKIEDAKEEIIIRAHGASRETYKNSNKLGIEIKDLTCPKVLKTHNIAEEYFKKGYFIILIGIKNHPESIATLSFCGENSYLLQEKEEIAEMLKKIKDSKLNNILIMAQTTYNSKKFDDIVKILNKELEGRQIDIQKTICAATEIRQKETTELSKQVDAMIIIGDKKSSNTNKLYDIAKENSSKAFFVQNVEELEVQDLKQVKKIGIMAGASTPKEDIEEIIRKIRRNF